MGRGIAPTLAEEPHHGAEIRVGAVAAFAIIGANAVIRLAYGVAVLTAPSRRLLGRVPLAPDTDRFPESRLFVRGFAAHQVAVGVVGLASLPRPDLRRPAMALAAATDLADIASAAVEARSRSRLDSDLTGGTVFSIAGLASALIGLRLARSDPGGAGLESDPGA
jgi:hypothetical protein